MGVEEELLLFDRRRFRLAELGAELADAAETTDRPSVESEFKRGQIETATRPQADMSDLLRDVRAGRREVLQRAAERGAAPAALGTDPAKAAPTPTDDPRYARMADLYRVIADGQMTCGMHVHVAIESREEGVAVIDRIGAWLPLLLAMSVNSPYWQAEDTGYASYRSVRWGLWPTAGPTEPFGTVEAYDNAVQELIASGAALDPGMIYFDARLSATYPTVEIRVMDVTPTPEEAVLLAALCRGLVDTAVMHWQQGEPPGSPTHSLLRAANWRAARFGLSDQLLDPHTGTLTPADMALAALMGHVHEALARNADADLVEDGIGRLLHDGTGADRQRRVFERTQDLQYLIAAALDWTARDAAGHQLKHDGSQG